MLELTRNPVFHLPLAPHPNLPPVSPSNYARGYQQTQLLPKVMNGPAPEFHVEEMLPRATPSTSCLSWLPAKAEPETRCVCGLSGKASPGARVSLFI